MGIHVGYVSDFYEIRTSHLRKVILIEKGIVKRGWWELLGLKTIELNTTNLFQEIFMGFKFRDFFVIK